jgi:preprotein translocase subunit SecB
MADTPPEGSPDPANAQLRADVPPGVQVVAQYVKDLSFENVNAPQSLMQGGEAPNIEVSANLEAKGMAQDMVEIELSLTVTATREAERLFLVEVLYAGLFRVRAPDQTTLHEICLVECPRLLFPFARRVIADATRDGGYTPLLLDPIDFLRLYRERQGMVSDVAGQTPN